MTRQPQVIPTLAAMRKALLPHRAAGAVIGLVPTMGALHAGHASLLRRARSECDVVVTSIYVNPTQFGPNEDFSSYPRRIEADIKTCADERVDYILAPSDKEMYGNGSLTRIYVDNITQKLCGMMRPGHFEGVCTVVAKLFNIVQPDLAYFGQKDAQQVVVLGRMVADLNIPVQIVVCPIVREPDGLAMSSRNANLSPAERQDGLCLSQALQAGLDAIAGGMTTSEPIIAIMRQKVLETETATIDYLGVYHPETLENLAQVEGMALLAGAIRLGSTRLIDNRIAELSPQRP